MRKILKDMGVSMTNSICPCCENHEESIDHLFIQCDIAKSLWSKFCYWWKLNQLQCSTLEDLWLWSANIHHKKAGIRGVQLAIASVLNGVWELRNEKVFKNINFDIEVAFKGIQETSFLLISSRNRKLKGDRLTWFHKPFDVF